MSKIQNGKEVCLRKQCNLNRNDLGFKKICMLHSPTFLHNIVFQWNRVSWQHAQKQKPQTQRLWSVYTKLSKSIAICVASAKQH